jgi:predicted DNA-binding protein (MmcQ/YjbR family)
MSLFQQDFMNKKHWNTVFNKEVSDALVKELIDHSYELVLKV